MNGNYDCNAADNNAVKKAGKELAIIACYEGERVNCPFLSQE